MKARPLTRAERDRQVARTRASFALEDMHPQADDLAMQQRYIDGEIGLDDMLDYARQCARSLSAAGRADEG